jgi:hypothetical protein
LRLGIDPLLVPVVFAAPKLVPHELAITHYGYFRDKLYDIECAKHLAWGYVDQPPFSIAVLAVNRALLADTTSSPHAMPYENGAPIFLGRGLNTPLAQRWPGTRPFE